MAHVKISKKDLKEDELRSFGTRAYDYIQKHQKPIMIVLAAICVVLIGLKIYSIQKRSVLRETNLLFTEATNSFQMGLMAENPEERVSNLNRCIENCKRIISDYGSSDIANYAHYLQASAAFFKSSSATDYDEAIRMFNDYIEQVNTNNEKAMGYVGLGYCYENKYFLSEDPQILALAVKAYENAIEKGNNLAVGAEAKLCKGRLLELQYKDDQAALLYQSVKDGRKYTPIVPSPVEERFNDPQLNMMFSQLKTMKDLFTFSQSAQFALERLEGQK